MDDLDVLNEAFRKMDAGAYGDVGWSRAASKYYGLELLGALQAARRLFVAIGPYAAKGAKLEKLRQASGETNREQLGHDTQTS